MLSHLLSVTRISLVALLALLLTGSSLSGTTLAKSGSHGEDGRWGSRGSYAAGFRNGYRSGFRDGRIDAFRDSFKRGIAKNRKHGSLSPYEAGFENGYARGYNQGYEMTRRFVSRRWERRHDEDRYDRHDRHDDDDDNDDEDDD